MPKSHTLTLTCGHCESEVLPSTSVTADLIFTLEGTCLNCGRTISTTLTVDAIKAAAEESDLRGKPVTIDFDLAKFHHEGRPN